MFVPKVKRISLRSAILLMFLALVFALVLNSHKSTLMQGFSSESLKTIELRGQTFRNLFQASYYFFYKEQFLLGIKKNIEDTPGLKRVEILSGTGKLIFDSDKPTAEPQANIEATGEPYRSSAIVAALSATEPSVFASGYRIQVLAPAGQFGILYTFEATAAKQRVVIMFFAGLLAAFVLLGLYWKLSRWEGWRTTSTERFRWGGLRAKFLATIVLINLITGGIVFFTLSALQTQEQSERIQKESVLFSQFSTDKIVADFSSFFYFYYQDKFLPSVKSIVSTNENLVGVKIVSYRTRGILFDSERASSSPVPDQTLEIEKIKLTDEEESQIKARNLVTRMVERDGDSFLSVVSVFRNENQESLFLVEYLFSFQTLKRSIALIRHQILIDLIPSMALGLLIAAVFAQLLISPVRRLVKALKRVSEGDYDVSVDDKAADEIGDLVTAFNSMTHELRKKTELRKYLSDSTYRQVMEAAESPDGAAIGGTRVYATVLFSDIRDFVSHCESLDAEEVTAMLNEYFSEMVEVVRKYGGEVDKFIGDAILAVFYATDEVKTIRAADAVQGPSAESTALQAIYCALEMRERLKEFNQRRLNQHKNTIEIGVGLTHGEVISGPIGAKDRMDFTVIGDVVNLANRIEKLSKAGKYTRIVFSHHIEEKVRGLLDYEKMATEKIKGKEEEVGVFELIRIKDIETLIGHLKTGDFSLRVRSLELLGQSRNVEAIPSVLDSFHDDDEKIRIHSVVALAKLSPPDHQAVLDAFFGRLKIEKSERVISAVITALGRLCTTDRLLELADFLQSSDERVIANAIEAMGQIRHPKCSDLMLPLLGSRNNRIKANAAMALFAAGHIEVMDMLKPMLMHSDPLMRSSAAFAIGELTSLARKDQLIEEFKTKSQKMKTFLGEMQECVPMLVSLLKDQEPMVKRQAIIALGKIKDKSAVLPILDNIDFEKDSRELMRDVSRALRAIGSHKLVREVLDRLGQ